MNGQHDIDKFLRLAEKNMQPSKLDYWRVQADKLAIESGKEMVVVKVGETFQVWPKSVCKSGWEYCTEVCDES